MTYIFSIIVLFIAVFVFFNFLYKKSFDYKNTLLDIRSFEGGLPYNLKIVNTGSTYSKFAFGVSNELTPNWGDLSLQAQSLEMDEAILKKYMCHIAPNGIVIVVVAVCLLLYREKGTNPLYYNILAKSENPQYKIFTVIKHRFPLLANPKKTIRIIKDKTPLKNIYESYPTVYNEESSQKEMLYLVKLWEELFELNDLKSCNFSIDNLRIMERNCTILNRILTLCISNDLRPIIVVPPFSSRMNQYFSTDFKAKVLNENLEKAVDGRPIPILNYQDDATFQDRPELFADGGFRLNKFGSRTFINKIADDLKHYGIDITNKYLGDI